MICYKDRTYCPFFTLCKTGYECDRALTQLIKQEAKRVNLPISIYKGYPDCFIPFFC